MKQLFIILLIMVTRNSLVAQSFTKGNNLELTNYINGATAWGDYDNDGDKDLVIIGSPGNVASTVFFINNGNGTFTKKNNHGFIDVADGDLEWDDYNNDGKLDLLISGNNNTTGGFGTPVTKIYKNLGDGNFQALNGNFINVYQGSVSWMDFNGDGKPDFLVSGRASTGTGNNLIALYKNKGNDQFEIVGTPFETFSQSDIEWADFDNDDDLDIVLAGYTGSGGVTRIYKNNGDETFIFHQQLTTAMRASIDCGDFNNDGLIDLVISGFSGSEQTLKVYKNGNGTFAVINDPDFIGGEQGSTSWVDYNNDGNLDIISSVIGNGSWSTRVYKNDGNDSFSLVTNSGLPTDFSNVSYIDFDNDGDLDVFFPSTFNSNNATYFYINNNSSTTNVSPNTPILNSEEIINSKATISWQESIDTENPQSQLTYNIYITHNNNTIVNGNSLANGKRKVLKSGNRQYQLKYIISNLQPGDYRWSVQAVDNSFNTSPFADANSFHINYPPVITGTLKPITTVEDTSISLLAKDLIINDPDNDFTEDFSLTILKGDNYTFSENKLTPALNFNGMLSVHITVNDGKAQSEVFELPVEVVAVNDRPVILGLTNPLSTQEITPITISLSNIVVLDPDNIYSDSYSLIISEGDNYTFENNTVTPALDFIGMLLVPIVVNDGIENSEPYLISLEVMKVVGLNEQKNEKVKVYPNPASNFINILLSDAPENISLIDLASKFVNDIPIDYNFEQSQTRIDVKSLKKGIYLILIKMKNRTIKKRMVIE